MRRKGKIVGLAAAAAGIAVLLLAVVAGKDWILDEWAIWQLGHGSREDVVGAARWLGQKKCVRSVRPLLRAMRRACQEWIQNAPSDSARLSFLLVGPASITEDNCPETLPPGAEHLEFLRAFNRIGDPATLDLLREFRATEDEMVQLLAANILVRILRGAGTAPSAFGCTMDPMWWRKSCPGLKA